MEPIEITQAMLDAGWEEIRYWEPGDSKIELVREIYEAMEAVRRSQQAVSVRAKQSCTLTIGL